VKLIQATAASFRDTNSTLLLLLGGLSCLRTLEDAARALSGLAAPARARPASAPPQPRVRTASHATPDDTLNDTAMLAVLGLLSAGRTLARLSGTAKPPRRRRRAARPAARTPAPSRPRDLLR
jgi:hypothetical protein